MRASMSSSIYAARCVLKTNEEIEIFPANYTTTHQAAVKLTWYAKGTPLFSISIRYNIALSLRLFYVFRTCVRRPGCFPGACIPYMRAACRLFSWSMELLGFCKSSVVPEIVDPSVLFIRILFYIYLWASTAEGIQPLEIIRKKREK